jgi:hypothetical protein
MYVCVREIERVRERERGRQTDMKKDSKQCYTLTEKEKKREWKIPEIKRNRERDR